MCDKCTKLDQKIAHYRDIAVRMTDKQTLDGIARLIKEMTDAKAMLHCEPLFVIHAYSLEQGPRARRGKGRGRDPPFPRFARRNKPMIPDTRNSLPAMHCVSAM